jgi:hypothetical protein
VLLVLACAGPPAYGSPLVRAEDIELDIFVNTRYHGMRHFYDGGRETFGYTTNLQILYVNSALKVHFRPFVRGALEVEQQWWVDIDRDDTDDKRVIRNAYLQAELPGYAWLSLLAGRQYLSVAQGMLYDDPSPVVRLDADIEYGFGWPVQAQAFITQVSSGSPYVHAQLKYSFSFLGSFTLLYGRFRDTDDGIAQIFNALERDYAYRSRGSVQWAGGMLRMFAGDFFIRATALYQTGSATLRHRDRQPRHLRLRGYLLDLNADYSLGRELTASAFFFMASGDSSPAGRTLRTFVAIAPYIDKTNIYFNGGIDSRFSTDTAGLAGIQVEGVMAPGLSLEWRPGQRAWVKWIGAWLLAGAGTNGRGGAYGWETDIMGLYAIGDRLQVFAEFNLFKPGSYYRSLASGREHVVTEVVLGLNYLFRL